MSGLGYELVELERSAGGMLRVTIDFPWAGGAEAGTRAIGVDDCEAVSRQLQYALEVEDVDYQRLEVSSPGVDRPLRSSRDFQRFAGQRVTLVLKEPIAADDGAMGAAHVGRKRFSGRLEQADESAGGWQLVWQEAPARRGGQKQAGEQVLAFELSDLLSARLAPELNFKRRKKDKGRRTRA